MGNSHPEFVAGMQGRVENAASLLTVIYASFYSGKCCREDVENACEVLCDYIDQTADAIREVLEEMKGQK